MHKRAVLSPPSRRPRQERYTDTAGLGVDEQVDIGHLRKGPARKARSGDPRLNFIDWRAMSSWQILSFRITPLSSSSRPPVAGRVPGEASRVGEQWREPLHPPVDGDVIDLDTRSAGQLLDIPH